MDLNIALIVLLIVVLIIQFLRERDCAERIRANENQTKQNIINDYRKLNQQAFQVWTDAVRSARESERNQD